ncbi:hypothetical protein [Bartonella quintana]
MKNTLRHFTDLSVSIPPIARAIIDYAKILQSRKKFKTFRL